MLQLDEIWNFVLEELKKKHSETFISLWISDLKLIALTDTYAVLYMHSEWKRGMLKKMHYVTISESIESVIGYKVNLIFSDSETEISPESEKTDKFSEKTTEEKEAQPEKSEASKVEEEKEPTYYETNKNEISLTSLSDSSHTADYTFENFIVGSSNKFAYAACTAVAQRPAHAYNPLFIYGPSGLGKTHLLYSITNAVKKNNPNYTIIYVKGEEFTNQMIESISNGTTMKFRERYRKADVLLIDDVHFIAGRDSTQEEFFHTFNDLYEHKKQIILTSDRPARDIQKLEERLRTRFEWGLTADIQPPDFELRIAIMKKKAEKLGKSFPNDVLTFLAEKLTNNIRQMEGAIKKIIAYSYLSGDEITIALATSCISDLLSSNGPIKVTPDKIVSKVAAKYGVEAGDIYSKKKINEISKPRHICIYLLRKITDLSYPSIGKLLNRDHSTIMNSYKLIEKEVKNNSSFEIEMNDLIKEITNTY